MLCRSVLTAIAVSYILCVMLLSGLQKEDIDVNTLKKLARLNVNIHDMNNETLRHECLGKANPEEVGTTQQLVLRPDDNSVKLVMAKKGYNEIKAETPDPAMNMHTKMFGDDESDKAKNKVILSSPVNKVDEKLNETENKIKNNAPTLESAQNDQSVTEITTATLPTTVMLTDTNKYQIVRLPYNIGRQEKTGNSPTIDGSQFKGSSKDKTKVQALVNEPNQKDADINTPPTLPLHGNKRDLNTIAMLNPNTLYLGKSGGASNSEFFPRISNIGQSPQQYNNEPQINTMAVEKPKDMSNNGKLEDWYSKYFMNNMAPASTPSYNNEKALLSIFNVHTNDNNQNEKFKDAYMEYNSILGNHNAMNIKKTQIEPTGEIFDVNSFIMNDDKTPEKIKDMLSPKTDPYNPDLFPNIAPTPENVDEYNTPAYDPNQILKDEKPSKKSSYIGNNPQFEDISSNFPNDDYQNAGDTKTLLSFGNKPMNNNYKQIDELKSGTFLGDKPEPDNFISSFRRRYTGQSGDKNKFLNFNNQYAEAQTSDERIPEMLTNNEIETNKLSYTGRDLPNNNVNKASKVIPLFLDNDLKTKEFNSNTATKPREQPLPKNDEVAKNTPIYNTRGKNNKNRIMERSLDMQYNPVPSSDGMIKGENLKLIMNSLKYINQILALNHDIKVSEPPPPGAANTETAIFKSKVQQKTFKIQTVKPLVVKSNKNNDTTKKQQTIYNNLANMKKIESMPTDFIKELAESVKNIILKDIRQEISTVETLSSTTETVTTTTPTTTVITTEKSTSVTQHYVNRKTKDANYVVQRILELFDGLKAETTEAPTTPTSPIVIKSYATKYEFLPNKDDSSPPKPFMIPYSIEPKYDDSSKSNSQLFQTFTNMKTQEVFGNHPQSDNISLNTQLFTYLQQLANQSPQHFNHASHLLNQPTPGINDQAPILNQGSKIATQPSLQMLNPSPQILNQAQQILTQPIQMLGQPQHILNQGPQTLNQPQRILNQSPQNLNQILIQPPKMYQSPKMVNQSPQLLNQLPQILNQQPQINKQAMQMMNPPSQITKQRQPQILNPVLQMMNHQTQMASQTVEMMNPLQKITDNSPQNIYPTQMDHGQQTTHHESQMITGAPQIVSRSSQLLNQNPQQLNHAQQILNQALQMINDSPQLMKQSPQANKHASQMSNQPPLMLSPALYRSSEMLTPSQQNIKHTPQISSNGPQIPNFNTQASQVLNQALQMGNQGHQITKLSNYGSQISNQSPQTSNFALQMSNQATQISNQAPQMSNYAQQIFNQDTQISNRAQQILNQEPQISNRVHQIPNQEQQILNQNMYQVSNQIAQMANPAHQMSHQALKLPNQQAQTSYRSSEVLNQQSQFVNGGVQLPNRTPQFSERLSVIMSPSFQYSNRSPQMSNQGPQMSNQGLQMSNQGPLMSDHGPRMSNQGPQISNQGPQMSNQDLQMSNPGLQMINQSPQISNQRPQISNQGPQMSNPRLQMSNQDLQMSNQGLQISNEGLQMSNQGPQTSNQGPQTSNQGTLIMNQSSQILNRGPQILNQGPQMSNQGQQIYDRSVQSFQPPQMIHRVPANGFEAPSFMTFQTNADEIPPLGIPIETSRFNQVIMITTKHPPDKLNNDRKLTKRLDNNRKDRDQNRSDSPKKPKFADSLKRHREPLKNRSSKHRMNSFYTSSSNQRVPYISKYKKPDYERARTRHDIKNFHEQLERTEDRSNLDRKSSNENQNAGCDDVPSRQQEPLTKVKQRSRYDDTHFRDFLKTQEKVNDMLEQILATRSISGRIQSVENP